MRTAKTLIRLGGCPGWSNSSQGVHVIFVGFVMDWLKWLIWPAKTQICLGIQSGHAPSLITVFLSSCRKFCHWLPIKHTSKTDQPLHDKTNKMTCPPSEDRSAWASAQSDPSSLCAQWVAKDLSFIHADSENSDQTSLCAQWVAKDLSFIHADSENSDQTERMPRLIQVFAGCTGHFCWFWHALTQMTCVASKDTDLPGHSLWACYPV